MEEKDHRVPMNLRTKALSTLGLPDGRKRQGRQRSRISVGSRGWGGGVGGERDVKREDSSETTILLG